MSLEASTVFASELVRGYGAGATRLEVLSAFSMSIAAGELVAVVGPSGVGKSTLLRLIGLLDEPESGRLELFGASVAELDDDARARLRNRSIGFVFQHHQLLEELDAIDNVALPLRIAGVTRSEARRRACEVLDGVGLGARGKHRPAELSGGERQRVAIARALSNRPGLLLADEPTGNLDRQTSESIFELIKGLHLEAGLTSIIVTHDESLAARCDRQVRLGRS